MLFAYINKNAFGQKNKFQKLDFLSTLLQCQQVVPPNHAYSVAKKWKNCQIYVCTWQQHNMKLEASQCCYWNCRNCKKQRVQKKNPKKYATFSSAFCCIKIHVSNFTRMRPQIMQIININHLCFNQQTLSKCWPETFFLINSQLCPQRNTKRCQTCTAKSN